jgi:hypothetical protein
MLLTRLIKLAMMTAGTNPQSGICFDPGVLKMSDAQHEEKGITLAELVDAMQEIVEYTAPFVVPLLFGQNFIMRDPVMRAVATGDYSELNSQQLRRLADAVERTERE